MKEVFDEKFKRDFMKMQVGEDGNRLKEKYGDISKFKWDKEMDNHFNNILAKYSNYEARKKSKKLRNIFRIPPLFDDTEFYEKPEEENYDYISEKDLDKEIDELVAKIRKDMLKK